MRVCESMLKCVWVCVWDCVWVCVCIQRLRTRL